MLFDGVTYAFWAVVKSILLQSALVSHSPHVCVLMNPKEVYSCIISRFQKFLKAFQPCLVYTICHLDSYFSKTSRIDFYLTVGLR